MCIDIYIYIYTLHHMYIDHIHLFAYGKSRSRLKTSIQYLFEVIWVCMKPGQPQNSMSFINFAELLGAGTRPSAQQRTFYHALVVGQQRAAGRMNFRYT